MSTRTLTIAAAAIIASSAFAAAQTINVGTFGAWSTFTSKAGGSPMCFVASVPTDSKYSQPITSRDPVFFMVTSTMQVEARLQMPAASHGAGVPLEDAIVISIFKTGDEPQIVAGADPDKPTLLPAEVGGYVLEGINGGKTTVIIKADREVPYGFVEQVGRAVIAVDGVRFSIGVRDRRE